MCRWLVWLAVVTGCAAPLPDADSAGAQVLQRRCTACHALPMPASMTLPMWQVQLDRMRALFSQRGLPWLSASEEAALQEYLRTHCGTQ